MKVFAFSSRFLRILSLTDFLTGYSHSESLGAVLGLWAPSGQAHALPPLLWRMFLPQTRAVGFDFSPQKAPRSETRRDLAVWVLFFCTPLRIAFSLRLWVAETASTLPILTSRSWSGSSVAFCVLPSAAQHGPSRAAFAGEWAVLGGPHRRLPESCWPRGCATPGPSLPLQAAFVSHVLPAF